MIDSTLLNCHSIDCTDIYQQSLKYVVELEKENENFKTQRSLNVALLELDHAKHLNERILRNVPHELRGPLMVLVSLSEALLADWDQVEDQKKKEYLTLMYQKGCSLHHYIENMLALKEHFTHTFSMDFQPVCLKRLVQTVIEEQYPPQKMLLPIVMKLELPAAETPLLYADERWLKKLLMEIISNALRFTQKGQISIHIKASEMIYPNCQNLPAWQIDIADTGKGVTDAELNHLFTPFYEASHSRSQANGRGLGLAVCQAVVAQHHGTIEAFSNEAKGLTVRCILPRIQPYASHYGTERELYS